VKIINPVKKSDAELHQCNSRFQCVTALRVKIIASFQASPVFCSLVCVQYNTRKQKSAKNGEGLVSFITCVTSGGREMDVGGEGHNILRSCTASVYYTERKPKNKKRGRPGNEANMTVSF